MNEATVQDELDFENLPQETKDLVKRLYDSKIKSLELKIEDLEDELKYRR